MTVRKGGWDDQTKSWISLSEVLTLCTSQSLLENPTGQDCAHRRRIQERHLLEGFTSRPGVSRVPTRKCLVWLWRYRRPAGLPVQTISSTKEKETARWDPRAAHVSDPTSVDRDNHLWITTASYTSVPLIPPRLLLPPTLNPWLHRQRDSGNASPDVTKLTQNKNEVRGAMKLIDIVSSIFSCLLVVSESNPMLPFFFFLLKSHVETLSPDAMVLGDEAFGKWLRLDGDMRVDPSQVGLVSS